MAGPNMAWSDFARGRNRPGTGYSYFDGTNEEVLDLVRAHWEERKPGVGRDGLDKVVVVPVPPSRFVCTTVKIADGMPLHASVERRQPQEDPYVRVTGEGAAEEAAYAAVVLYSKEALVENDGTRSSDADWEVVSIIASPFANEPMHPLTMARNMLEKPGGTKVDYTAIELAESIYYWSQRVKIHRD